MSNLFRRYDDTSEQLILLSYEGGLTFDLVQLFIDRIESGLLNENYSLQSKKKIYNVLVEVFQNVSHNLEFNTTLSTPNNAHIASLKVWIESDFCTIATGNHIETTKVQKLEHWIAKINGLDKEELRSLHKEVLNNGTFSEKGGGGLGFLDIARKTGNDMKYKFEDINTDFSYFNFETRINLEKIQ